MATTRLTGAATHFYRARSAPGVRKLKVVIVSFAHVHAPGYAEQLARDQRVELAGFYDEDEARGRGYAQRYNVPFYPDLASMLERVKPDVAVVCSPTKMHVEHVKLAAERGAHLFIEKPLARTVRECDEIIAAVSKAGVKATVGFNARFDPANAAAKAVVERGELGRVLTARVRIAHSGALDRWFDGPRWFADAELAGGGGFLDLGVHGADLLRWLLGEARGVVARVANLTGAYPIDDFGAAVIEFGSGAVGVLEAGWVQRAGENPLEVYGDRGTLVRGPGGLRVYTEVKGVWGWFTPAQLPRVGGNALSDLIDAALADREPLVTLADGRAATEIMQAAYMSSAEGRYVRLPL